MRLHCSPGTTQRTAKARDRARVGGALLKEGQDCCESRPLAALGPLVESPSFIGLLHDSVAIVSLSSATAFHKCGNLCAELESLTGECACGVVPKDKLSGAVLEQLLARA